jgi:alpha-glucoside transport system substrate-binding protein
MKRVIASIFVLFFCAALTVAAPAAKKITVLGVWGGQEADVFIAMCKAFTDKTGIKVDFEATRDLDAVITTRVEAGNPPDVSALTGPGKMIDLANKGKLVDLSKVLDMGAFGKNYAQGWKDLGSVNGKLYGVFTKAAVKGLVWYNPKALKAAGFDEPKNGWTWNDMLAASAKIEATGAAPWAVGIESGAASGWVGTDWIENIFLRMYGPQKYRDWYEGRLAWASPEMKKAWQAFGQIVADPKMAFGGGQYVNATNFGNAAAPLFAEPAQAYFHQQASFIQGFIAAQFPGLKPVEDFNFVGFPAIEPKYSKAMEVAADLFVAFKSTPEVKAFMNYISSAEAQAFWAAGTGGLGTNKNVALTFYPDALTKRAASILNATEIVVFDASDMMKPQMNSAFWTAIVSYVDRPADLDNILADLDKVRLDAYKK